LSDARSKTLPEEAKKLCLLALDVPEGPILCPLSLPVAATIQDTLLQGRLLLQELRIDAGIDWERAATGVWGVRCDRETVPRDGDRIEVYRPLTADPRDRRRRLVRAARRI
jgi:putative ubiquitin-RnfH superfamily antitoxin RatB of RatAB toxin-antitoxin module